LWTVTEEDVMGRAGGFFTAIRQGSRPGGLRVFLTVATGLGVLLAGSLAPPAAASPGPEWLPLKGSYSNAVGCTWNNGCVAGYHGYPAVDFEVPYGTPVFAAGDGMLTAYTGCAPKSGPVACGPGNFGNAVRIAHPTRRDSWYAHLSRVARRSGPVRTGQLIGWTGRSGSSHNTHLHYEERWAGGRRGSQLNPGPMAALHDGRPVSYPRARRSATWQLPCGEQPGERCKARHKVRNQGFAGLPIGASFYGDWDGNGTVTPGVVRRTAAGRLQWHLRNSHAPGPANRIFTYGLASDVPVVGDWDGRGGDGIGVARRQAGRLAWYLRNGNGPGRVNRAFTYGLASDLPVVGNWDGKGGDGIGVARRQAGRLTWYLRNGTSAGRPNRAFRYGLASDLPVVGNWDGKGGDGIGVARRTAGRLRWYLRNRTSPGGPQRVFTYGMAAHTPITGNWDGRGGDTVGVLRGGAVGRLGWYLRNRNSAGRPHAVIAYGLASDAL